MTFTGFKAAARSICNRWRAGRKAREAEERFRGVFEHSPFGVCVSGLDGRILQVNSAFCRMLGYSEQELSELTWAEISHPEDVEPSRKLREQLSKDPYVSG